MVEVVVMPDGREWQCNFERDRSGRMGGRVGRREEKKGRMGGRQEGMYKGTALTENCSAISCIGLGAMNSKVLDSPPPLLSMSSSDTWNTRRNSLYDIRP